MPGLPLGLKFVLCAEVRGLPIARVNTIMTTYDRQHMAACVNRVLPRPYES